MQGPFPRKYGVETTIDFTLFEVDGVDFRVDAVATTAAAGAATVGRDGCLCDRQSTRPGLDPHAGCRLSIANAAARCSKDSYHPNECGDQSGQ